jgi:hypothetical protein
MSMHRAETPSTGYFETPGAIQGPDLHRADIGSSPSDFYGPPPSLAGASSDSSVNFAYGNDSQAQLTHDQLGFVASLQKANVPHAEIISVMDNMRKQAAGGSEGEGEGAAAPPIYDFKGK